MYSRAKSRQPNAGAGSIKLSARILQKRYHDNNNMAMYFFFLTALSDKHSDEEKNDILNEYFYRFEEEILRSPEDYMGVIWNAFMIIEKS